MYNDQLLYKVVIWAFFGISLWKETVALTPGIYPFPIFKVLLIFKYPFNFLYNVLLNIKCIWLQINDTLKNTKFFLQI